MSGPLIAEFRDSETLQQALMRVKEAHHQALDAFTPYPVDGLDEQLAVGASWIRYAMLAGGLIVAAFAFGLQWYSAVIDYPLNSGGRPLNSWQVFLLVPFEVGVFAAALSGVIAFMWSCGLPRLHHPLFEIPGFERATQDRFFLLASAGPNEGAARDLRDVLEHSGAVVVTEVRRP
jgi:ActD protein